MIKIIGGEKSNHTNRLMNKILQVRVPNKRSTGIQTFHLTTQTQRSRRDKAGDIQIARYRRTWSKSFLMDIYLKKIKAKWINNGFLSYYVIVIIRMINMIKYKNLKINPIIFTTFEYVNKISNWAIEDGKLHGFGYERSNPTTVVDQTTKNYQTLVILSIGSIMYHLKPYNNTLLFQVDGLLLLYSMMTQPDYCLSISNVDRDIGST
ncbi:hypothetical protein U3516DRAFT_760068 [Neocallimastix sp. 'constans']